MCALRALDIITLKTKPKQQIYLIKYFSLHFGSESKEAMEKSDAFLFNIAFYPFTSSITK